MKRVRSENRSKERRVVIDVRKREKEELRGRGERGEKRKEKEEKREERGERGEGRGERVEGRGVRGEG